MVLMETDEGCDLESWETCECYKDMRKGGEVVATSPGLSKGQRSVPGKIN